MPFCIIKSLRLYILRTQSFDILAGLWYLWGLWKSPLLMDPLGSVGLHGRAWERCWVPCASFESRHTELRRSWLSSCSEGSDHGAALPQCWSPPGRPGCSLSIYISFYTFTNIRVNKEQAMIILTFLLLYCPHKCYDILPGYIRLY